MPRVTKQSNCAKIVMGRDNIWGSTDTQNIRHYNRCN